MTATTNTSRFKKRLLNLEVTGLVPLPAPLDDWERAIIEPALARILDADDAKAAEPKEVRDGEAR